ncbi:MAG: c-type cytochrome [Cryomorphaceae bacterium]|nr:c-type cytochrome [Cryomorphaceae bacterium]
MTNSIRNTLIVTALSLAFATACKMTYDALAIDYNPDFARADVAEGKRLTTMMCGVCHFDQKTGQLTGVQMVDVPKVLGTIIASNITQHEEKGIGKYTDAELAQVIRTGIARDGRLIPFMQKPNLADDDLRDIIAFLRSDDPMVKASDIEPGETKYSRVGKMAIGSEKPTPWKHGIQKPGSSDKLAYGKYLIDNLACYDCHSKSFAKVDKVDIEKSKGFMGGGNKMLNKLGEKVLTPNLTPHETGIKDWTEADFARAITQGFTKGNKVIAYPMPLYPDLNPTEISAMFAYLQSIPAIKNQP